MRYLNLVKNQFLVSRAWMLTSLVLVLIILMLIIVLLKVGASQPVRIVTLDYLANNGYAVIDSTGNADNSEYLISIATSDVTNYTTWNNHNIKKQYQRFTNRFTPALYNKQARELLDVASKKSDSKEAQTFFVDKTLINKNTVKVIGTLRMYQGIEQTKAVNMTYTLKYNTNNQIPRIEVFTAEEIQK